MVTLSVVLDLEGVDEATTKDAEGNVMSNNTMFVNISRNFIATYANQNRGLTYEEQRIYGKLMSELKALENKKSIKTIDLEDDWYGFLKTVIKVKMMPGGLIPKYFDLVENPLSKDPKKKR